MPRTVKKKDEDRLDDLAQLIEKIDQETERRHRSKSIKKSEEDENSEKVVKKEETKEENRKDKKDKKAMIVKKDKKDLALEPEKLERIEKEIKKQTTISDEKKNKINKAIFHNIAIANIVMLYFIFLVLGYQSIPQDKFMIDLQVFSIITLGITIFVFEKAYKNDSTEYAIHGIEALFLSIVTLISIYLFSKYVERFANIMVLICYLFDIYFVGKSIVVYLKMKKKALKRTNDIRKIAKQ